MLPLAINTNDKYEAINKNGINRSRRKIKDISRQTNLTH